MSAPQGPGYPPQQQPGYGQQQQQPGYGQQQQPPAYGQQPAGYGPPPTSSYPRQTGSGQGFGIVSAVFAVVGAVLGVVAFTAVNWFSQAAGETSSKFSDVHDLLNQAGPLGTGIAKLYFSWLAWVLLGVAFVVAILATLPTPASAALRVLGALVALAGIGITFWAVKFLTGSNPGYTEYLKHARLGFYFTLGAFLLIGIGALIGPRRKASTVRAGSAY